MKNAPHIVWKGMTASPALEERIRAEIDALEGTFDRIAACRVVIEQPHRHHRHGNHFDVKIEVTVPGQTLVVSRDPASAANHEDAYAAVNDAFGTMRRQLESYIDVRRGD